MYFQSLKNKFKISLLIILFGISHFCFATIFSTQLSSDQIMLGDSVYVTYVLNNTNATNASPDFSALQQDFHILNTNFGTAVNMVNGVTSMQTFWRLQLEPKKVGELTIPEINLGNDKFAARKIMVSDSPNNLNSQNAPSNAVNPKQTTPVFVRSEISTSTPYVQSQLLYKFKLYFRNQLRDPRIELPQTNDSTFFQLGDGQDYQTTVNGEVYNVVEKNFAIFPKKSGAITLPSLRFHAFSITASANAFNDPFSIDQPKAVAVATTDYTLNVRAVPTSYPNTTWLPAKNISLTEEWSNNTKHWEAGTPVTRTITIEAQGLRADQLPDLSIDKINGVSVYADRPQRNNTISSDMVVGTYQQKITYIPNSSQPFSIPAVKINWWDTKTDSTAVAQLNSVDVQAKASANVTNSSVNSVTSLPTMSPTTQTVFPATLTTTKAFYSSIWFWIACLLFITWLMTLWFMLRKKSNPDAKIKQQTKISNEISEKTFEHACHTGQAVQAQQYLLAWAKAKWPSKTFNLAMLREIIQDEAFNSALQELERNLYAKKAVAWNGETLLTAFHRVKKTGINVKKSRVFTLQADPLPPLNP